MNPKNIKKQKISTLRTKKIAYWVFCALITTETLTLRLWVKFILFGFQTSTEYAIRIIFGFEKSPEYEYEYYSVLKNHPNTNTNIIRFENITRIRIRISLFGLNYSNIIRIPNYSLTSEWKAQPDPTSSPSLPQLHLLNLHIWAH